jgi:phage baseplate assembly protein W
MATTTYQDIDISFGIHPSTKDILKLYDVTAAKFALRNVLLTSSGEKLDDFGYGAGIKQLQFELMTPPLISFIKRKISEQISIYLPEIAVQDINVASNIDTGELNITLTFYVRGNLQLQKYSLVLERAR